MFTLCTAGLGHADALQHPLVSAAGRPRLACPHRVILIIVYAYRQCLPTVWNGGIVAPIIHLIRV